MIIVWEQGKNAEPSIYHGRGYVQNWAAAVSVVALVYGPARFVAGEIQLPGFQAAEVQLPGFQEGETQA